MMKNLLFLLLAFPIGCDSESEPSESDVVADWALQTGTLRFRTPDVYGDDDSPKPAPELCFVATNAAEVWVAEVVDISDVIFSTAVDCASTLPQVKVTHQVVQLIRSNGEQSAVVLSNAPHDQLVSGQRVLMGVLPANDLWLGVSYLLIDGPANQQATPGMPEDFEALRQELKAPRCEMPADMDPFIASIFEPSESACDSSQPSNTEVNEVTDNDL